MNNNHDKLIKLHKTEKRLLDINNLRGDLPNKINIITRKINSLVNENSENQSRLEEIEKRKKVTQRFSYTAIVSNSKNV